MSLIKIEGVQSLSAPTRAQKDAAIYMFGSKGHSIVAVLDKFSRVKELRTAHIDGLLKLMKEGEDDEIIKFTASAAGKKSLAAAKQFATAKTMAASIKALKLIRVPMKWIEGHSDAAAARITETKEIRARKTAGNKPEKPIKLDNPQAPDAEDTSLAGKYDAAHRSKNTAPFEAVHKTVKAIVKQFGLTTELHMGKLGETTILVKKGRNIDGRISFPSSKRKLGWTQDDPNKFFLSAINDEERDTVMDYYAAPFSSAPKIIAKAFEALWIKSEMGEYGNLPVQRAKKKAAKPTTTYTFVSSKNQVGGIALFFNQPGNDHDWILNISQKDEYITSDHEGSSAFQTSESFFATGFKAVGAQVVWEHEQPGVASIKLASKAQATAFMDWVKKQKKQTLDFKTGPKIVIQKAAAFKPSGKSPDSLVDSIAETPARKIAALPLQGREEYFNALNVVIQRNMPHANVIVTSDGLTITKGSKMHAVSLTDKGWFIKTGATGKPKRIGVTFDIVDLLGMIDKSILKPKA